MLPMGTPNSSVGSSVEWVMVSLSCPGPSSSAVLFRQLVPGHKKGTVFPETPGIMALAERTSQDLGKLSTTPGGFE